MTKAIQWRRGTTAEHSSFTGLSGEITIDTTKKTAIVHDEATVSGFPLAREDLSNVPDASLSSRGLALADMTNVSVGAVADLGIAKTDLSNVSADATETEKGLVELATISETIAGTNTTLATTPAGVKSLIALPTMFIQGLVLENDTDAEHDIKINVGKTRSADDTTDISLASVITKQIDASWTAGNNAGGMPSPLTVSANMTYHLFVIMKLDGTIDVGFDTSLTATNLLSDATDFVKYRRIGSVTTDASANIVGFTAYETAGGGVKTVYKSYITIPYAIYTGLNTITLPAIPTNLNVVSNFVASPIGGSTIYGFLTSLDDNDLTPTSTYHNISVGSHFNSLSEYNLHTSNGNIRLRTTAGLGTYFIIYGYTDGRIL